jgi:cytochrome c-type biogenesis protein CcmH/NrfF
MQPGGERTAVSVPDVRKGGPLRRKWVVVAWSVLAAAAVTALAVAGTGGNGSSRAARVAMLERDVRCPSCLDLSVAQSSSPSSIAVRRIIEEDVAKGESDGAIVSYLEGLYGPSVLLRPEARGVAVLVWLLPVLVAAAMAAGLGAIVVRRTSVARRAGVTAGSGDTKPSTSTSTSEVRPPIRLLSGRRWLVAGAIASIAAGGVVLGVESASGGTAAHPASSSITLRSTSDLDRAVAKAVGLEQKGHSVEALQLFEEVLARSPRQPVALAEAGWLEFEAGVSKDDPSLEAKGKADEAASVAAAPNAYSGHLYLGTILLAEGDARASVRQYRAFLADGPPASLVASAKPFLERAFEAAGEQLPPGA